MRKKRLFAVVQDGLDVAKGDPFFYGITGNFAENHSDGMLSPQGDPYPGPGTG